MASFQSNIRWRMPRKRGNESYWIEKRGNESYGSGG